MPAPNLFLVYVRDAALALQVAARDLELEGKRRLLVCCGTGCIGSNLAAALVAQGRHVRILRRPSSDLSTLKGIDVDYVIGDVRDPESLRVAVSGCSLVFHAAALVGFSAKHREEQHRVNVLGTRNVVDACLASGVLKLVHVSSIAALGYFSGR